MRADSLHGAAVENDDLIRILHRGNTLCNDNLGRVRDFLRECLADERIRDLLDIKVYVEADADERILRRIVRDVEERGRDLRGIISQYLTTVKPMHYMYVEPTRALADIVINSGKNDVAFDLFVSKIGQLLESTGSSMERGTEPRAASCRT